MVLRSICVFCGARPGHDPAHAAAAVTLGRTLAEQGIRLVYGGGAVGLMGIVADAALAAGGQDNGAPGLRPDYGDHYFAAFVLDPEGHRIEAVCKVAD